MSRGGYTSIQDIADILAVQGFTVSAGDKYADLTPFGRFLMQEIDARQHTLRGFAAACGLAHTTILKYVRPINKKPSNPDHIAIAKMSAYLHYPFEALLALAYPDAVHTDGAAGDMPTVDSLRFARRIESLPPEIKDFLVNADDDQALTLLRLAYRLGNLPKDIQDFIRRATFGDE